MGRLADDSYLRNKKSDGGVLRLRSIILRFVHGSELLETRILSERIEHGIESKQRGSQWCPRTKRTGIRDGRKFLQCGNSAVGLSCLRCHPGEKLHRSGTSYRVLLDGVNSHPLLRQLQRGGLVTKAHIGQSKIPQEDMIFRLFFQERFQFDACLSPAFLGSHVITSDLLRPA